MPFLPAALSVTANTIATSALLAGRDELLDAVQHVAIAAPLGARRDRAGVRADVRLGQAEAAEPLAARERLQVVLLLRVGAERVDRPADDGVLHADDRRRRAVAGGDLLERDGERHVVDPGAAPRSGHDHAERAELAQRAQRRRAGKCDSRSQRAACGASCSCANARIVSRTSCCSSVSSMCYASVRASGSAPRRPARASPRVAANTPASTQRCAAAHAGRVGEPARARARPRARTARSPTTAIDDLHRAEHERSAAARCRAPDRRTAERARA